jgi:type I restriction enzyme S subunit
MTVQVSLLQKMDAKSVRATARLEEIVGAGFTVKKFVENFDVLVNVTGSTKHLKEMVLQLAVRGGLSGPTNETAASLVTELERARGKLTKAGVRVGDPTPPVSDDEAPHALPPGWCWVRLRDLGGFLGGGTPSKSNDAFWKGPLPWVSPKDMKRPYIDDAEDHISPGAVQGSAVKLIPARSVIYVVRGMILAHSFPVAITTREVTINQDMKALVLAMPELSEFILRSCQAARRRVLATVERSSHGTCRLESERVEMLPIALPPLAEQKRIVAKVDELMALCDDLEARQTEKREIGTRLTRSALEALTSAEGPEEFDAAWARVVENFDVLIDRAEKVPGLRRAILDQAVRGRLCTPSPHTAASLVADLRHRRAGLTKAGIRVGGVSTPVTAEEAPYCVPASWRWVRLRDLGGFLGGGTPSKSNDAFWKGPLPWVSPKDMKRPYIEDAEDHISLAAVQGSAVKLIPAQSVLYVVRGMILAHSFPVAVTTREVTINQDMKALVLAMPELSDFILRSCQAARGRVLEKVERSSHGTCRLESEVVEMLPIALPPLAEQGKILARVEQLMKICDELEAQLLRAEDRASKLVEAVVQELVA